MVAQTADAVWLSVRRVIEPLLDPTLADLCTPRPGHGFDAAPTSPRAAACSSSPDNTRPRTPCRSSPRWPSTG